MKKEERPGTSFLGMPEHLHLDSACALITEAFGDTPWLVGSCLTTTEWRDVDVRLIMDDEKYEALFGKDYGLGNSF